MGYAHAGRTPCLPASPGQQHGVQLVWLRAWLHMTGRSAALPFSPPIHISFPRACTPHKPTAAGPAQQPAQLSSQWATSALQKSTPHRPRWQLPQRTTPDVPTVTSPRVLQRHMRAACTAQPRLHFCGRPQHTSTSRTAE